MKSTFTLVILLLITSLSFGQDKTFDLLNNKTRTHILYDRVFGISNAAQPRQSNITSDYFMQVYHEIQRADFLNRLPKLASIRAAAKNGFVQNQIPLSILITDFEKINPQNEKQNFLVNANNQLEAISNTKDLFDKHSLVLMAPLVSMSKTNRITFSLQDELIFNTTNKEIKSIAIQTNGEENWKFITRNSTFEIVFSTKGKQTINCKIEFDNQETVIQSFTLEIDNQNRSTTNKSTSTLLQPNTVTPITATISYQGYDETAAYLGQGEYEIFPDTVDGILDKPVILLDGFDPGDARNIATMYAGLNYGSSQNLADYLRSQGFDIILLNFPTYTRENTTTVVDGGVDYIQRNAMILVELINQINAQKVGSQKNVVIGPSMGGLIARYALRYMETNTLNHDTRLYISFDTPHLGANVPIGFQHLFNYMAFGPLQNVLLQPLVTGMLKSPAGREMLIDQFEGHLQPTSTTEFNTSIVLPTGCPNFRTVFQNELNTLGFPQNTRNIAISNGASNGTTNGTPGMEVMNHTFNTSTTQRAIINLHYTPYANQNIEVSRFKAQQYLVFFWATAYESYANSKSPAYTNGLDTAPGGRFDMSTLSTIGGADPTLQEFFANLTTQYFDFIPTLSSMAISDTTNLYSPITSASNTPFVTYSIPTVNENHVTLTDTNATFAINEIINGALSTTNPVLESLWIKNPVKNTIEINTNYTIDNAFIKITDVLGKTIFQSENNTITGTFEIPLALNKGVYLITIGNDKGSVTKKIITN
jgi:pimeloyl-ACP methyl ester carboxylesterase